MSRRIAVVLILLVVAAGVGLLVTGHSVRLPADDVATASAESAASTPAAPDTAASVPLSTDPPSTDAPPPLVSTPAGAAAAASGKQVEFAEDFSNPKGVDRFDFQLHTSSMGDVNTKISDTFVGEHDESCAGPTTHRTVHGGQGSSTYTDVSGSELIWYCAPGDDASKGHMMTALDTTDIATLSFSPKQTFTDVTEVCWDQNMNNLGEAKWVNVFIVPADDVARDGDMNYAAATGLDFGGLDKMMPDAGFQFTWLRGSTKAFAGYTQTMDFWKSVVPGGMLDDSSDVAGGPSAPRFTICLNSGGDLVIDRPDGTVDTEPLGATFPTGEVKVIFQDASYNPAKHAGDGNHVTWHWDNITVAAG